jgi:Tol biopolymer transport system component
LTPSPIPVNLAARIAFVSERDGNEEIYLMNTNGALVNLTNHPAQDSEPSWSPEGTRIAFVSSRDGKTDIYVMNVDGSGLTNLTNHPGFDISPVWSPNGTRIAFLSDRDDDNDNGFTDFDIYVTNLDGSEVINLTNRPVFPRSFAWSPNSRWLVFWERGQDQHESELYRINVSSLNLVQLTNDSSHGPHLAWSPDGSRIAFNYGTEGPSEIHVMNFDGTGRVMLTHHSEDESVSDYFSAWSPDGSRIAFESDRDGYYGIYTMNADGSNIVRLIDGTPGDWFWRSSPSWSPDGTQIAFSGGDPGEIYLINVNDALEETGKPEPINLTNHPANDNSFAWEP